LAIGKPVALEARAELRETRGFISMTTISPVSGFTANCTLDPPQVTPTARMTARDASRSSWSCGSVSVRAGATVTLSPVCTPMGSTFSMEQTTTALSALSRMTSSSYSCQPSTLCSRRTWPMGLSRRPCSTVSASWSAVRAMPPPAPPSVYAGRTTSGKPMSAAACFASSREVAMALSGTRSPMPSMAARKAARSSARWMTSASAPIISTPQSASTLACCSSMARLSAVCPPRVGSSASGRSISMMCVTVSTSSGSTYVRSATSGSVMMVAGFELTRTTS